jgi:hypothetical protein
MIIGLVARAEHGKDTAADYLVEKHGFVKKAFAEPLKSMLIVEGYCTYEECYVKKTEKSRLLMQVVGDLFRKYVSIDYFVKELINSPFIRVNTNKYLTERKNVVISDIRMHNEAEAIKDAGGILIKIERLNADGTEYRAKNTNHNHPSEKFVDEIGYDFIIEAKSGEVDKIKQSIEFITKGR